jgi:hypothetical protein
MTVMTMMPVVAMATVAAVGAMLRAPKPITMGELVAPCICPGLTHQDGPG